MDGRWVVLPFDVSLAARLMLRGAATLARCSAAGLILAIIALDASVVDALARQAREVVGGELELFPYLLAATDPIGSLQRLVEGLTIVALTVPIGIPRSGSPSGRTGRTTRRGACAPAGGFQIEPKRLLAEICPIDAVSPRGSPLFAR
ncbi:MAG: hypothetical protein ACRDJE_08630 [Dehalococcoidia bacterium]